MEGLGQDAARLRFAGSRAPNIVMRRSTAAAVAGIVIPFVAGAGFVASSNAVPLCASIACNWAVSRRCWH
eukprot:5557033-Alexandrium_andersonii.AAC.1